MKRTTASKSRGAPTSAAKRQAATGTGDGLVLPMAAPVSNGGGAGAGAGAGGAGGNGSSAANGSAGAFAGVPAPASPKTPSTASPTDYGDIGVGAGTVSRDGSVDVPVTPGARITGTPLQQVLPASKRVGLSLYRCRATCDPPKPIPGGHILYKTLSDRDIKLRWSAQPRAFLVMKKWKTPEASRAAGALATWLLVQRGVERVWMGLDPGESPPPDVLPFSAAIIDQIDVVVCMGGDGTVLYVSSLFPSSMPPVVSISHGSLGFLTSFNEDEAQDALRTVLAGHTKPVPVTSRTRLCVKVMRKGAATAEVEHLVLNELCVDRGISPYMASLEATVDGVHLTTVQADGILIATPTGSTAYSLSAGGPLMYPTLPGIVFTPISPHSLSFRPCLFPDSAVISLRVPDDARACAQCTFDGRNQLQLHSGDSVVATVSAFPVPLVAKDSPSEDFVHALHSKLHWNIRERQKPLNKL